MENEMITLKCPSCGREISVPSELESFSCLYCGARLRMADLIPPTLPADEADRAYAEEHLLDCIRDFPNYYKQFTRKKYAEAYKKHLEAVRPVYEAMDRWVCSQPAQRERLLADFAEGFVEQWEAFHQNNPKARTRHTRERLAFANKLTLAWFTVPAIRDLGLSISEEFPQVLRDKFVARYPDNRFEPGTYEEIASGFRKRGLAGLFSNK